MAKKKRKPVNHKNSNYQKNTTEAKTIHSFENMIKDLFRERVKLAKNTPAVDATLFDGLDYGNIFRKRRNQAICATLDRVVEITQDLAADVKDEFSVEKEWAAVNTLPIPAYDFEEEYTHSVLGTAIWILDQIKAVGRTQELRRILDPANEYTAMIVPPIWDPCHDAELIYSMVDVIYNRNNHGDMAAYTYFRRPYITEDVAEGKINHNLPNRSKFNSVMKLIPQKAVSEAVEHYQVLYWDWVRRYYQSRIVFAREQIQYVTDMNAAMKEAADAVRQIESAKGQIRERRLECLIGNDPTAMFSGSQSDFGNYQIALQNGYRADTNFERLEKRKEAIDQKLYNLHHLVGFIPQKTEIDNISLFNQEIAEIWKEFDIRDPYELCFAFMHLLDSGSDLPWCYYVGVNLHTTYAAVLPWPRMVHNETCDGIWHHYHPETGEVVSGPEHVSLPKRIKIPDLEDWYTLRFEKSNADPSEESELYSLAQIIYEATGCIMPRKMDRYLPALKLLDQYGITGKRALHPLLYCMTLLGEAKHQTRPPYFHPEVVTDVPELPEEKDHASDQTIAEMQAELERLRTEVKTLKQQAYESSREVRDEKQRYQALAQKAANDAQELHDLRELIFHLQNEEMSESHTSCNITFPYRTTKRIVVFGGSEAWTKEMRVKLPDVIFIDRTTMPNSEMVKRADAVWIQTNAFSHKHFYKVMEDVRKYNIPLRYFSFSGVSKSAEQLVQNILR